MAEKIDLDKTAFLKDNFKKLIESHRYILNREAEYLGVKIKDDEEFQLLLDEITKLRRELLDASNTILDLKQYTV